MKFYFNKLLLYILIITICLTKCINKKKQISEELDVLIPFNKDDTIYNDSDDVIYQIEKENNYNLNNQKNISDIENLSNESVNENVITHDNYKTFNKLKHKSDFTFYNLKRNFEYEFRKISETNNVIVNLNQIKNKSKINSIKTSINLFNRLTDGYVKEKVFFELLNGSHDKIIRKISLGGTSDSITNLKVNSYDVMLTKANLLKNCYEDKSIYDHSYMCVIVHFESILITNSTRIITIEFEYNTENILKKREKPFNNKEIENVLVFVYDNYKSNDLIKNSILSITLEYELERKKLIAYPERYAIIQNYKSEMDNYNDFTTIIWNNIELKPNEYKNFVINIPYLNINCKEINQIRLEINAYSVIEFIVVLSLILAIIILVIIYNTNQKSQNQHDESDESKNMTFNSTTCNSSYTDMITKNNSRCSQNIDENRID